MGSPKMLAYFTLDHRCEHYKIWGESHVVRETVGAALASATGGHVTNVGRVGASGRCYVLLDVSETAAELLESSPEDFVESVFSTEKQDEFGILGLKIKRVLK